MTKNNGYKIGDKVLITVSPKNIVSYPIFVGNMDQYKGKQAEITNICDPSIFDYICYNLNIDRGQHSWREDWLLPVNHLEDELFEL